VFLPTTFSSIIIPISAMVDSFIIINLLVTSGYTSHVSTIMYGLWGGVVQPLISIPTILIEGISTCIVPSLSGVVAGMHEGGLNRKVTFFIKVAFVLALIMFAVVFVFAEDILVFLYGDGLSQSVIDELFYATKMLRFSSISIIYYALLQTFTAILQSVGKSQIPLIALVVGVCARIILTIYLVSIVNINIFGAIIANTIFLIVADFLLAIYIKLKGLVNSCKIKQIFYPLVAISLSLCMMFAIHKGLSLIINYFMSMVIAGIVGVVLYIFIVYFGSVFDSKEKREYLRLSKNFNKKNNKNATAIAKSTEK
jgi:stage V sporulation protein B